MNGEGSLLWGLRDASTDEFEPLFPEMADVLEITDGCAAQFQGQTNAGRVARSASGPSGVRRQSIISIAGHGKNNCDHQGATNTANVRKLSLSNQSPLFHGTRNLVLALSMFFPKPTKTHESKSSAWAPKDLFYAFYDDSLLDRPHQQFTAYRDSKIFHSRTGMQLDASAAETRGTLALKRLHCACTNCKAPVYDFWNCSLRDIVGKPTRRECVRVSGKAAVATQTQALADFSIRLKRGKYWPVRADDDERAAEGPFWLAFIINEPERLAQSMTYAGQTFNEGWIVVKVKWCTFIRERSAGARLYKVQPEEVFISVGAVIRVETPMPR